MPGQVRKSEQLDILQLWNRQIEIWAIGPPDLDPEKEVPQAFLFEPAVLFPKTFKGKKNPFLDEEFVEKECWLRGQLVCYHESISVRVRDWVHKHYLSKSMALPDGWSPNVRPMVLYNATLCYRLPQPGGLWLETKIPIPATPTPLIEFNVKIPDEHIKLVKKLVNEESLPIAFTAYCEGGAYDSYSATVSFDTDYKNKFLMQVVGDGDRSAVSRTQARELARVMGNSIRVLILDEGVPLSSLESRQAEEFIRTATEKAFHMAWKAKEDLPDTDYEDLEKLGFTDKEFNPEVFTEVTTKWARKEQWVDNIKSHYEELQKIFKESHNRQERESEYEKYLKQHLELAGASSAGVSIVKLFSGDAESSMSGAMDDERAKHDLERQKQEYYDKLDKSLATQNDFEQFVKREMEENWQGEKTVGYFIPKHIRCKILKKTDFEDVTVQKFAKAASVALSKPCRVEGISGDFIDLKEEMDYWQSMAERLGKLEQHTEQHAADIKTLTEQHAADIKTLTEQHAADIKTLAEQNDQAHAALRIDPPRIDFVDINCKKAWTPGDTTVNLPDKQLMAKWGGKNDQSSKACDLERFAFDIKHAWVQPLNPSNFGVIKVAKITDGSKVPVNFVLNADGWFRLWVTSF